MSSNSVLCAFPRMSLNVSACVVADGPLYADLRAEMKAKRELTEELWKRTLNAFLNKIGLAFDYQGQ